MNLILIGQGSKILHLEMLVGFSLLSTCNCSVVTLNHFSSRQLLESLLVDKPVATSGVGVAEGAASNTMNVIALLDT